MLHKNKLSLKTQQRFSVFGTRFDVSSIIVMMMFETLKHEHSEN